MNVDENVDDLLKTLAAGDSDMAAFAEQLLGAQSQIDLLAATYNNLPSPTLRRIIDRRVAEIIGELPALKQVMNKGPALDVGSDDFVSFEQTVADTVLDAPDGHPLKGDTEGRAVVYDLGVFLDNGIKAILGGDTVVNRLAYHDVLGAFALLSAALLGVKLTPEQTDVLRNAASNAQPAE